MAELSKLRSTRRELTEWVHANAEKAGTVDADDRAAAEKARSAFNDRDGKTIDAAIRGLYGQNVMTRKEIIEKVGGKESYERLLGTEGAASRLQHISGVVEEYRKLGEGWNGKAAAEEFRKKHSDIDEEFFNLQDSADTSGRRDPRWRGLPDLLNNQVSQSDGETNLKVEIANLTIKRDGTASLEARGQSSGESLATLGRA